MSPSSRTSRVTKNPKDYTGNCAESEITQMSSTSPGTGHQMIFSSQQQHVPNFQISMPSSFHVSQPNFYTEVNPMNLTTNPNGVNAIIQPTSDFNNTENIDEDYDT